MKVLIQKNIKSTFLVVLLIKLFVNGVYEFIKAILEEYKNRKKIMKEYFNKNLIMSQEEHFKKIIVVGFVKNLLIIIMEKTLEIIVT